LYPYFLAFFFSVFGHSFFVIRLVQVILAPLTCYLVCVIARLLFEQERIGLAAALIAALYQPFIFYDGEVEKTALGVVLGALALWAVLVAYRDRRHWLTAGIFLSLATLVRSNFFLLSVGLGVVLAARWQWRGLLYLAVGAVIVLGPVIIRNSLLAKEPTFTTTQAGQNLYIGNSPYNRTGDYAPPPWIRHHPRFEEEDFKSHAENKLARRLSPGEVSRYYFRQSLDFAIRAFGSFAKVTFKKALLYFNNYEVPDNQDIAFVANYSPILKLPLLQFGLVFALALSGLILVKKRAVDYLIWAGFILFAASVIAFFVFSRYRVPSVTFIMPYAAFAVVQFYERLRVRDWRSLRLPLGLAIAVYAVTLIPLRSARDLKLTKAQCFANLATRYYQEDSVAKAIAVFNKALAIAPYHSNSLHDLGVIYFFKKDYARAEQYLTACLAVEPTHYAANFFLGRVYDEQNRWQEALPAYEKARQIQPGNLEIQFNIATVCQRMGRYADALATYEAMLKIAPDNPLIYHNLSVAYFNLKQYDQAKLHLDRVKALGMAPNPQYEEALHKALIR
jgi:tetratricopeptide (TPR) repeat protein